MITLSLDITGGQLANNMADDMEECSYFFIHFTQALSQGDWKELEEMITDNMCSDDKPRLKILGDLLLNVSKD